MALLCLRRVVERLQAGLAVAGDSGQQLLQYQFAMIDLGNVAPKTLNLNPKP